MRELSRSDLFIAAMVALAALLVWAATGNGAGLHPDSIGYIRKARSLLEGGSVFDLGLHWPPGYPLLLAGLSPVSGNVISAARWLCIFSAVATLGGLGLLLKRNLRGDHASYSILLLLVTLLLSPAFTHILWQALSEGVFIAALVWAVYATQSFIDKQSVGSLLLLAACVCLMAITRYTAAPFIAALVIVLVLSAGAWSLQWRVRAAFAVLLGIAPLLVWLLLNDSVSSPRELSFHPMSLAHLSQFNKTLAQWITFAPPWLALGLFLISVSAATYAWWQCRSSLLAMGVLMIVGYLSFLALTISFMDAHTSLAPRILSPLLPIWLLVLALSFQHLPAPDRHRAAELLLICALGINTAFGLGGFSQQLGYSIRYGDGFADSRMTSSPIFAYSSKIPAEQAVYTNAGEFFYLLFNRETGTLPRIFSPNTRQLNPELGNEIESMLAAMERSKGVIVWVEYLAFRDYLPTVDYLTERLPLEVVATMEGGQVLRLKADLLQEQEDIHGN